MSDCICQEYFDGVLKIEEHCPARSHRLPTYRELLLGCGHKRDKRMWPISTPEAYQRTWRNLETVDRNRDCHPDFLCDLSSHLWRFNRVKSNDEILTKEAFDRLATETTNRYDEIHAYEVLEHLGAQGDEFSFFAHFSEIWRMLKPNGHLLATVPSRFSPWLWGDPSHKRAILPESISFLSQLAYVNECDREGSISPRSDFRYLYHADFDKVYDFDNKTSYCFILRAVKPAR